MTIRKESKGKEKFISPKKVCPILKVTFVKGLLHSAMVSLRTAMAGTGLKLQEKDGYVLISPFGYNCLPCCHMVLSHQNKGLIQKGPKAS